MKINGAYVGLGLGDSSEEIRLIKAFMRRKFSYAKQLADTPDYDADMVTAVVNMQGRYNQDGKLASSKYTSGIINAETKYVMGYLERPPGPDTRPVLFTACGTGVPYWIGYDADTARAVESKWRWQPCAYPATAFPMGPSIEAGRGEVINQFNRMEPGFELRKQVENYGAGLAGYSQGGCVVSEVWEKDIKPANGVLNWAKPHMLKAVTFGNPDREMGKAWPDNSNEPVAPPNTSGVTGTLMVDTPDWWRNYAHKNDLYTAGGDGSISGDDKTAIWQIIRGTNVFSGPNSILRQVLELLGVGSNASRVMEIYGAVDAILDSGMFFVVRGIKPHTDYNIQPAVDYLLAA